MAARRGFASFAFAAALITAGFTACGIPGARDGTDGTQSGETSRGSASSSSETNSSASESTGAAPETTNAAEAKDKPVVKWIRYGPAGANNPPEFTAFEQLGKQNCGETPDVAGNYAAVWGAAMDVCKALESNNQSDWERARKSAAQMPQIEPHRCLEIEAARAVNELLDTIRLNPDVQVLVAPGSGAGEACPVRMTGLTVVDSTDTPGRTKVRVDGFFEQIGSVLIDGQRAVESFDGDDSNDVSIESGSWGPHFLILPAAPVGQSSATITLLGPDDTPIRGSVVFVYPPAGAPAPSKQP